MDYTYEQLHEMTVAQLREIAAATEHEAVQGALQMNKEHLLPALCEALGIEAQVHHHVVGIDKKAIKSRIRALKEERAAAIAGQDAVALKRARRRIHRLKRKIRRATV